VYALNTTYTRFLVSAKKSTFESNLRGRDIRELVDITASGSDLSSTHRKQERKIEAMEYS